MAEQNRSDHSRNVTEMDGNVTKVNDILERLQEQLDGPIPWTIERQDVRDAITEIERLRRENRSLHLDLMIAYSEAAGMYDKTCGQMEAEQK